MEMGNTSTVYKKRTLLGVKKLNSMILTPL